MDSLKNELADVDWNSVLLADNIDGCYTSFIQKLNHLLDKCTPYKRIRSCKNIIVNPWMTKGLLKSIRRKRRLYKQYLSHPAESNKRKFVRYKNKLTNVIRAAKKNYYTMMFNKEKNNLTNTWKLINNILKKNKKPSQPPVSFKVNNSNIVDPKTIAHQFNNFFTNVGPELAQKIPGSNSDPLDYISDDFPNSLFQTPITTVELCDCINKLPSKKSKGHDEFDHQVIKRHSTVHLKSFGKNF